MSFGTDGEEALINALSIQLPNAHHIRCFLHFTFFLTHTVHPAFKKHQYEA